MRRRRSAAPRLHIDRRPAVACGLRIDDRIDHRGRDVIDESTGSQLTAASDQPASSSLGERFKRLLAQPEAGPFALLVGAIIVFTLLSATFISVGNISNLLAFTPELGMIALAMTLLMTVGRVRPLGRLGLRLHGGRHVDRLQRRLVCARDRLRHRHGHRRAHRPGQRLVRDPPADPLVPGHAGHAAGRARYWRSTSPAASRSAPGTPSRRCSTILVGDFFVPTPFGDLRVFMSLFWFALFAVVLGYVLMVSKFGNWIQAAGGNPMAATARGVRVARTKISLFILTAVDGRPTPASPAPSVSLPPTPTAARATSWRSSP